MADISKIEDANGNLYNIADTTARRRGMPEVTAADNGKFAMVVNGAWAATSVPQYTGGNY